VIANSWPVSIRDDQARADWQWKPAYDLNRMTSDMLDHLIKQKGLAFKERPAFEAGYPDFPLDNYVFTRMVE
jgi:hypothetical protein